MSNDFWKKKYEQAEPIPAKFLHSDGSVRNEIILGTSKIEDAKTVIIDISNYTEEQAIIEITPQEGKDGIAKVTVILTNIPTGSNG